jgi:hypothetical protein
MDETEAEALREIVLRARATLEASGFSGESLDEQIDAALQAARDGELSRQELARLRERITELEDDLT